MAAITSILIFFLLLFPVYSQAPTPTPGTPEEWSDWLDGQPDVEMVLIGEYAPVATYGGVHRMPRLWVKQSRSAGIAVELEVGYVESTSPIDPAYIGGLRSQGYTVTDLADPVLKGKPEDAGPRPTPDHAGPPAARPTPRRPPQIGSQGSGGRVVDVVVSAAPLAGGERKDAAAVSSARRVDVITGKVKVAETPWHKSLQVFRGPVWVKTEVER